ncbi:precorrin-2 dehydrogenase/sirohydrochlorin ferrochelatase family protein [Anaerobacillus alkaliphilus]|uniref:precorrin-2 dehydrogenase/sirohydrochlorin ferrochelatase family protein n=1 Tax=Anaerobacillus alkaliphilus TaxID=1548597 RepID=UPI00240D96CE|nr:NAD(P)-dependent oxidoreductase [Anaerobacillus alkaliphilus]
MTLKLRSQKIVIVGGGVIAERKLRKLLETGAIITLISPEITDLISTFVSEGKLTWKNKNFSKDDLTNAFIIIAATNSREVNQQVYEACNQTQLINVVDNPALSNFFVPSTFRRGKLEISVSTSGASPGLSKKIVEQLYTQFDDSYEWYLDFLADARSIIQERITEPKTRYRIQRNLLEPIFYELTRSQSVEERRELLEELLTNDGEFSRKP